MENTSGLVAVNDLTAARKEISAAVADLARKCMDSIGTGTNLTRVKAIDEGMIWDSTHQVTGKELNRLITEVQGALSSSAGQRRDLWNSLIEVYATINKLDENYLSKIEKSFDQIHSNYQKIQSNNQEIRRSQGELQTHRERIDDLIKGHETSLKVLRQFKDRIDKLAHLEEINASWERVGAETHSRLMAVEKQLAEIQRENRASGSGKVGVLGKIWGGLSPAAFVMAAVSVVALLVLR